MMKYCDEDLIRLIRIKDRSACNALYDEYAPALYGEISRSVNDQFLAAEILEEIFVKIYTDNQAYNPKNGRFFTWMIVLTRQYCTGYLASTVSTSILRSLPVTQHES